MLVNKLFKEESGAVMVMVALGLVVIMGAAAMVIDAGMLYFERAKASNAVDAAVLAGVQELPDNPNTALSVAQNYVQLNGIDPAKVPFYLGYNDEGKAISLTGDVDEIMNMFFARAIGINEGEVKAHAKARVGPATKLGAGTGVVPIGVLQDDIKYDQPITMKEGGGNGLQGWYGSLDLESLTGGNGGSSTYEHYLTYGYDGEGTVGYNTLILEENGNMNSANKDAIKYRMDLCAAECDVECTPENYDPDCPRLVVVPVGYMEADNKHFHVTSFAAFFIMDYTGNGNDNYITGQFIKPYYISGAEVDDTITDNGVYARVLCE